VAFEPIEPDADRAGPEKLGERGGDGLDPRLGAGEVDVGVDGVAHRGQDPALRHEVVARDAEGLPEPQPRLDAARPFAGAVVVDDALDPFAPDLDLGAVRQDRRVLERDRLLVVEAVGDPALQLLAREVAGVHAPVKGVEVVVARSQGAQAGDELVGQSWTSRPS
jgi:hypothetical protein